jgi:hypothetical protein
MLCDGVSATRSLQAFKGWWSYLCLAAPSAAMIIVEWSTFEVGRASLPADISWIQKPDADAGHQGVIVIRLLQ